MRLWLVVEEGAPGLALRRDRHRGRLRASRWPAAQPWQPPCQALLSTVSLSSASVSLLAQRPQNNQQLFPGAISGRGLGSLAAADQQPCGGARPQCPDAVCRPRGLRLPVLSGARACASALAQVASRQHLFCPRRARAAVRQPRSSRPRLPGAAAARHRCSFRHVGRTWSASSSGVSQR